MDAVEGLDGGAALFRQGLSMFDPSFGTLSMSFIQTTKCLVWLAGRVAGPMHACKPLRCGNLSRKPHYIFGPAPRTELPHIP